MALLRAASERYDYGVELEKGARIWRGGCIIRCQLLPKIVAAYHSRPELPTLLPDPIVAKELSAMQFALFSTVEEIIRLGIPAQPL